MMGPIILAVGIYLCYFGHPLAGGILVGASLAGLVYYMGHRYGADE